MSQVYNFNILLDTSSTSAALVITEIMYNPPESGTDSLEFIEIYNNDAVAVDLLNYKISYGTTFKVFNTSYSIAPGEYAIIAVNPSAVDAFYGVSSIAGPTVGISNGGTFIKLNSPSGLLVDSVSYLPASPWPVEANGGGASLTLCDPNTDNSDVNNWSASTNLVGVIATVNVYADPNDNCTPDAVAEFPETTLSLFPNPASDRMSIAVPENASVISIFNNMGMLVTTINAMPSSVQEMDISGLSSGLYYLNLQLNNGENITGSFMIVR